MDTTTPAMRLHDILLRARNQPDNIAFKNAWAATLGITKGDLVSLNKHLVSLHELLDTIIDLAAHLPGDENSVVVEPLHKLRQLFSTDNYGERWDRYKNPLIKEDVLYCLKSCNYLFRTQLTHLRVIDIVLPSDILIDLNAKVTKLFDEVRLSDIDGVLKKYIMKLLESIRQGIAFYEIHGAEGLNEHLASIIGHMRLYQLNNSSGEHAETTGGWMKRTLVVMNAFYLLVAAANTTVEQADHLIEKSTDCLRNGHELVHEASDLWREHGFPVITFERTQESSETDKR